MTCDAARYLGESMWGLLSATAADLPGPCRIEPDPASDGWRVVGLRGEVVALVERESIATVIAETLTVASRCEATHDVAGRGLP